MTSLCRKIRAARVSLASVVTVTLLALAPSVANAAPQEPWVLPAADLSGSGQDTQEPQVAIAADGSATSVWRRSNGTHYIVQAATRPSGGIFSAPVDLSATGQSTFTPQVAIGPDGSTTAVWYRSNGTNFIIQAATRPAGGVFSAPVDLSATGQNAFNPQIATGPDGSTTAVWYRSNGTHTIIQAATRPAGGMFSAPVDLSATGQNAVVPQVVTGTNGTTVVWRRYNGTEYIIQTATRPSGGVFALPVDLSATGQNANTPQIAIGADDTTTAVWYRYDGTNFIIQASTRTPGGDFALPNDISAAGQDAFGPQIAVTPDGSATAVWYRYNGTNNIVQAATRTAGGVFSAPLDLSASGQSATAPQIAVGPDGAATATWRRYNGANYIIQSASTAQPSPALSVTRSGTGSGRVTSSPTGIDCGTACSNEYLSYTKVSLTATPNPGSSFSGWDGACSGMAPSCEVTMLEAESVDAGFAISCKKSTLKTGRFKANRRKGTGILKVTIGSAGTVTLKGSKTVRKSVKKLNRKGTVTLKVKAKVRTARKLKRNGSARLKLKLTFRPKNGCKTKTRTRTVKLVS